MQGDYRIAGLEDYSEGKIESKTIVYYAINYRTYTSPVKVISFSAKELKKNARLIAAVNKKLSEGTPGIDTPLAGRESTLNLAASLAPGESRSFTIDGSCHSSSFDAD